MAYGFPLIFSALSTLLFTMGDRYFITYFLSYSALGIYSLGYKLASVLNVFIIQSFQLGFYQSLLKCLISPAHSVFSQKY